MQTLKTIKRRWIGAVIISLAISLIFGCGKQEYTGLNFFSMDTIMEMSVLGDEKTVEGARKVIEDLAAEFSVTDSSSDVYRINHRDENTVTVSEDIRKVLDIALDMANDTDGALNPALYPISHVWGFTTGENRVPSQEELAALLPLTDWRQIQLGGTELTLPDGMELDFGAVAKGYASDLAADYLRTNGVKSAYMSLGGNVYTLGKKQDGTAWKIGIQNPEGNGNIGVLQSEDEAIITSGDYQRYFEADGKRYHHIIDRSTGSPAESGLVSVTIICENGLRGDALSTALFVMGLDEGIQYWREHKDFEAIFVTDDQVQHYTSGLEGRYTPASEQKAEVIG